MGILLALTFIFLFGIACGYIVGTIGRQEKAVGELRVETSDPDDGPYLFLELHTKPEEIMKRNHVKLTVNTKSFISHE